MESEKKIVFNPTFTQEVVGEALIIVGFLGAILYGSFIPYTADSWQTAFFFCSFFLLVMLIHWIPKNLTNHITLEKGKLYFRHPYTPWELHTIKAEDISEVNIFIGKSGFKATFKLVSGEEIEKDIKSWEPDLISSFLYSLSRIRPSIVLPPKYADLVSVYENKELFEQKNAEYNRRELIKILFGFGAALVFALIIAYHNFAQTGQLDWRSFGDSFAKTLESLLH